MIDKNLVQEALIITFFAVIIALIYNTFNPKGLGFLSKKSEIVSDSILFSATSADTSLLIIDTNTNLMNNKTIKDTTTKLKNDTIPKTQEIAKAEKIEDKSTNQHNFKIVTFEQMKRIIESPNFVIIDARRPEEYTKAHIPNAINLFAYEDEQILIPKILSLPKDKTIIIYCDGGTCDLSHHLAEKLINSFGFTRVFLYEGGWEEWSAKVRN